MAQAKQKYLVKKYIVVEVSDRNHHLCRVECASEFKYQSLANGRSRTQMQNLCDILNKEEEKDGKN